MFRGTISLTEMYWWLSYWLISTLYLQENLVVSTISSIPGVASRPIPLLLMPWCLGSHRAISSHDIDYVRWVSTCMADSRFAPSQWEAALLCNDVSHWLDASLESALYLPPLPMRKISNTTNIPCRAGLPISHCPTARGKWNYQSGKRIWTEFFSLFHISRSKNFKILEVGEVMTLRKGKPCRGICKICIYLWVSVRKT